MSSTTGGSSPRVRGTLRCGRSRSPRERFIPACAGNARARAIRGRARPVHPRVCGERPGRSHVSSTTGGSSPRVRGTLRCGRSRSPRERFIPACAGNARARAIRGRARPVHPRVCGERFYIGAMDGRGRGSSPRVRGTHLLNRNSKRSGRFIPACAGNACESASRPSPPTVHPRVCGERPECASLYAPARGSSPRVRGTLDVHFGRQAQMRFIPACAGNASSAPLIWPQISVHPRVCGERACEA